MENYTFDFEAIRDYCGVFFTLAGKANESGNPEFAMELLKISLFPKILRETIRTSFAVYNKFEGTNADLVHSYFANAYVKSAKMTGVDKMIMEHFENNDPSISIGDFYRINAFLYHNKVSSFIDLEEELNATADKMVTSKTYQAYLGSFDSSLPMNIREILKDFYRSSVKF